jgi:hypothetical protein
MKTSTFEREQWYWDMVFSAETSGRGMVGLALPWFSIAAVTNYHT